MPDEHMITEKVVFLAEDDMDDQEMLIEAVRQHNPSVQFIVASTGSKAWDMLQKNREKKICVIVLDFNLPEMSGAEILSRLQEHHLFSDVPKVVWSTSNSPVYQKKCFENGAHSYIVKPTGIAGIRDIAQQLVELCMR